MPQSTAPNTTHDGRFERTSVRLPSELIDKAEALTDRARDWPQFENVEPSISGILRLAIRRGLALLEAEGPGKVR